MCVILNESFFIFHSPLEQFEISSYNTFLIYNTTLPLELFNQNFFFNYNPISSYNLIDLIFIFIFIKGLFFLIKQDGFIFLYIFLLIMISSINFFSFTDFIVYEGTIKASSNFIKELSNTTESLYLEPNL